VDAIGATDSAGKSNGPAWSSPSVRGNFTPILLINETSFVDYHRLGSTARILTDVAAMGAAGTPAPNSPGVPYDPNSTPTSASPDSGAAMSSAVGAAASAPPPAGPGQTETQTAGVASPTLPITPPAASPAPPAEPAIPEVSMSAATGVPDQPTNALEPAGVGYSLKVTSRLVDVGLVAYDKKGHQVTDLKAGDLEIYDNGRKEDIRSFGLTANPVQVPGSESSSPKSAAPESQGASFANRAPDVAGTAPAPTASESGSTILAIDESHIAGAT